MSGDSDKKKDEFQILFPKIDLEYPIRDFEGGVGNFRRNFGDTFQPTLPTQAQAPQETNEAEFNSDELFIELEEAKEKLKQSSITVKQGTLEEAKNICQRDIYEIYPYIYLLEGKYGKSLKVLIVEYEGVPCGFSIFGSFEEDGINCGEVGMLHVSPEARSRGFMKLLGLLSRKSLVDSSQVLYSAVADKSGAIDSFLTSIGYENTGKLTDGAGRYPIWQLVINDPVEIKGKIDAYFKEQTGKTINSLVSSQPDVEELDKDNPLRESTNVISRVSSIYSEKGFGASKELIYFFGYWGSPISIRKCGSSEYLPDPRIVLSVDSNITDENQAKLILDKVGLQEDDVKINSGMSTTDIVSTFSHSDSQDGQRKLMKLAEIGDLIAKKMRSEG